MNLSYLRCTPCTFPILHVAPVVDSGSLLVQYSSCEDKNSRALLVLTWKQRDRFRIGISKFPEIRQPLFFRDSSSRINLGQEHIMFQYRDRLIAQHSAIMSIIGFITLLVFPTSDSMLTRP